MSGGKLNIIAHRQVYDGFHSSVFFNNVILGALGRPFEYKFIDDDFFPHIDGDVLFINPAQNLTEVIKYVSSLGVKNIGVFASCHTAVEDCSYYNDVDYVLRPYLFDRNMVVPNGSRCADIAWIPLGYKTGVGPTIPESLMSIADRSLDFFYSGAPDTNYGERLSMINTFNASGLPGTVLTTAGFTKGMSVNVFRATLERTRFALCPGGTDPETFRLFEALETGTIPISLNHSFLHDQRAMAGCPIVKLNGWGELPMWYAMVKDHDALLEQYRSAISHWWREFKIKQQQKVADIINRSFDRYV